jgi:hypothetical protein
MSRCAAGSVGRHRDRIGQSSDLELKIESDGLSRCEPDPVSCERAKPLQFHQNPIRTRRKPRDRVPAVGAAH